MAIVLIITAIVIFAIVRLLILFQDQIRFFITGLDQKFSLSEIITLWRLAKLCNIDDNPQKLYYSVPELSKCITQVINDSRNNGTEDSSKIQSLLSKLYQYRTEIELKKKHGLDSSRDLDIHQKLRVIYPGCGVFYSEILNNGHDLIIKLPTQDGIIKISGEEWIGKPINVYLWRKGDANYVFDTVVKEAGVFNGQSAVYIEQSDNMLRVQKRRYIRCACKLPAQLYIIKEEMIDYSRVETESGYKCILEDISEEGALVRIGGAGVVNAQIKLQFTIQDSFVVMFGIIRTVEYNSEINQSRLHFECTHIDPVMRNTVLSYVYNTIPEEQKEINEAILQTETDAKEAGDVVSTEEDIKPLEPISTTPNGEPVITFPEEGDIENDGDELK